MTTKENARRWNELLSPYYGSDRRRSIAQLSVTAASFAALWAAMFWSLGVSYWLTLLLAFPTAGFMMRLFMIQHDCGHGSYFKSQKVANAVGFMIGVLTLTPYHYWRKTHAYHHAHSGDLDFRGFGDIDTRTLREYLALPRGRRLAYRIYRHPLILFLIGPLFHFVIKHRYPWDIPRSWKREWGSIWWTNVALVAILATAWLTIGIDRFLLVQIPITVAGSSLGVWLFYVQHQYETTYWYDHPQWDYFEAGLHGSSHLVLPAPLQWLTANIGLHHVHHISARIPNYKLPECLSATPELQSATRITVREGLRTMALALWDEKHRRLIRFRDVRLAVQQGELEGA
jgi:omega-6 fatty acid desaturase (delta-12 desaturase)